MNGLVRLMVWILAVLLVMAPVVGLLNGWFAADQWPLKKLRLTGEYVQVSDAAVRGVVLEDAGTGFFAVDLDGIRQRVEALPWVRRAEVRKSWPDTLEIRITERHAVARWGDDRLLSRNGELFSAPMDNARADLPLLEGPDDQIQRVVDVYRRAGQLLEPARLVVSGIRLDARGSWTLQLADGAVLVVGRGEPDQRLRRFAKTIPNLLAVEQRLLQRVDLRYPTGYALSWQPPVNPEPDMGSTPES